MTKERILVVSDSHGYTEYLKDVIEKVEPDMLIHCGDTEGQDDYISSLFWGPSYFVRGNCDRLSQKDLKMCLTVGNHKVMITHGHLYGVGFDLQQLEYAAEEMGADVVLFGHTHVPLLIKESDGMVVMNPGSISKPRGQRMEPSYGIIMVDEEGDFSYSIRYLSDLTNFAK